MEFLPDPRPALVDEVTPASIDSALDAGELSISGSSLRLEASWIDEVLERRAPSLSTRARAAVATQVASAADVHGIDPLVVLSIVAQESRFDPEARGLHGALGLMQLRPFVARDVARRPGIPWEGESTLRDPAHNVAIGTAYLGEILQKFGDLELALAGYNMGPYRLKRMLARGQSPKGEYLGRILTHYADLAGLAAALESGSAGCAARDC
jgi:soluble lytic murein transglycosylase-like protein